MDTIQRELSKRGIEYRTVGDAVTKFIDLGLTGKLVIIRRSLPPTPLKETEKGTSS